MAKVAAAKRKKATAKKRKKGGFVVNRNTYIRKSSTAPASRGGEGGIITVGEALFLALGIGVAYLAFDFFSSAKASGGGGATDTNTNTPTITTPGPVANYCALPSELVERRINGGVGCGCSKCSGSQGSKFNFATESM